MNGGVSGVLSMGFSGWRHRPSVLSVKREAQHNYIRQLYRHLGPQPDSALSSPPSWLMETVVLLIGQLWYCPDSAS